VYKKIFVVLLTGTFDNPARDAVTNKEGYNGIDGCFCKEKGETVANKAGKKTVVVHPFTASESLLTQAEYVNIVNNHPAEVENKKLILNPIINTNL